MKNAWNKFRSNLDATREDEAGDIVQTILIIAVFVVIVVVVGNMLYKAIKGRATGTTTCINNVGKTGGLDTATSVGGTGC